MGFKEYLMENVVIKNDKLMRLLNITIEEAREDYARATMPLTNDNLNGMGVAHGGAIFSLADIAFGSAATAGKHHCVVSLTSHMDFLRPGSVGPLVAEARLVRGGQHVMNYEVDIFDANEVLIAKCLSTGFRTSLPHPAGEGK